MTERKSENPRRAVATDATADPVVLEPRQARQNKSPLDDLHDQIESEMKKVRGRLPSQRNLPLSPLSLSPMPVLVPVLLPVSRSVRARTWLPWPACAPPAFPKSTFKNI